MEPSTLKPFVRKGLDILFVGLNPAGGSSRKGHYFSVNAAFWNQLHQAGLITDRVNKETADEIVFGSTILNRNGWNYGITDLVTEWAESDSTKVELTDEDCSRFADDIRNLRPRIVVLLHSKVRGKLAAFLRVRLSVAYGRLGRWVTGAPSEFFAVPFPHGNAIATEKKVRIYQEIASLAERGQKTPAPVGEVLSGADERAEARPLRLVRRRRAMVSRSRLELAVEIDHLIERWLRRTGLDGPKPRDAMPLLIEHGIFNKDHREGLPLRKLLRELDDAGQLSVMKTARCERKRKNRSWSFHLPDKA